METPRWDTCCALLVSCVFPVVRYFLQQPLGTYCRYSRATLPATTLYRDLSTAVRRSVGRPGATAAVWRFLTGLLFLHLFIDYKKLSTRYLLSCPQNHFSSVCASSNINVNTVLAERRQPEKKDFFGELTRHIKKRDIGRLEPN